MIRVGSVKVDADRVVATIRGLRDRIAGSLHAVAVLDARSNGTSNNAVMGHLLRNTPSLLRGMDTVVRAAARRGWKPMTSTLESVTYDAGKSFMVEIASRLRSGSYVTNTESTRQAKARAGLDTTPGIATGQLAVALENAAVVVE